MRLYGTGNGTPSVAILTWVRCALAARADAVHATKAPHEAAASFMNDRRSWDTWRPFDARDEK